MPKQGVALLSDVVIRKTKPTDKTFHLRDGGGLWLVVEPSGKKWWKLRVVFAKKESSFPYAPKCQLGTLNQYVKAGAMPYLVNPGLYHNSVPMIDASGDILGVYRKMHIPDDPGYYEKYYLKAPPSPWR